jgi:hypothetical protein
MADLGMTIQQTNEQQHPQHCEEYKVQKFIKRIENKLALRAKAASEGQNSKN